MLDSINRILRRRLNIIFDFLAETGYQYIILLKSFNQWPTKRRNNKKESSLFLTNLNFFLIGSCSCLIVKLIVKSV